MCFAGYKLRLAIAAFILGGLQPLAAGEARIAVAANFAPALRAIADNFSASSGHDIVLSPGSTGKHYAQIINGAPFDAFFSADAARPMKLEQDGLAEGRYTYAIGRLVLWSPAPGLIDPEAKILATASFRFLAIANPELAPYGKAAQETLTRLGLWEQMQPRLVRGENINQAFQFVASGNAELGFVAKSQLKNSRGMDAGSYWEVPAEFHAPIEQQAVLLSDSVIARAFMDYVKSAAGRDLISQYGYDLPMNAQAQTDADR